MRFCYAVIAAVVWNYICPRIFEGNILISEDARFLSLAIIIAGALAGGD